MSEYKGVRGPWVIRTVDGSIGTIETEDGETMVAQAFDLGADDRMNGHEKRKANARLIAAAPELFEALNMIHLSFGGGNVITFSDRDIEQIGAAIAKAIGD